VTSCGFEVVLDLPMDVAIDQVKSALADQGFGVLTEIDVEDTLRTKLGEEVGAYRILGACNPSLAHRALTEEPSLGLLLPCNVVVRAHTDGGTQVEFLDPTLMVAMTGNDALRSVADGAAVRLRAARDALAGAVRE
jgi:uncharacterized protein (DUF302 family)